MIVFVRCVAEAVAEHGVRGLVEMVPGGKFAADVAASAWQRYRLLKREAALRADLEELARANFDDARRAAAEAVRDALPADTPDADKISLELYLTQLPGAVRQTLKRPDDPTGLTTPAAFDLASPDDVVKLLPARPPRFAPGAPLPGKPGWVLADLLGAGGFGEVWLAKHPRLASLSGAVKFCHGERGRDLVHESGLIDRVMAAGRHPGIVPLLDVHLDGDAPWVMFEYVPGGDLADLIREWQALPPAERLTAAVGALAELAAAVGHFHRLTPVVVHRDLKPSNILRDRAAGRVRVTDFGIGAVTASATIREETAGAGTRAGRLQSYLRGSHTPLYASPQQRDGAEPDPRDDVHALGVIAYQMFIGRLDAEVKADFARQLKRAEVPDGLIELIGDSAAEDVTARPADAAAFAERLTPWLPTAAAPAAAAPAPSGAPRLPPDEANQRGQDFLARRLHREAAAWFLMAARDGHAAAQVALAQLFEYGQGVAKNYREAIVWFQKAADQGNVNALFHLGRMYETGRGVQRDFAAAAVWYGKAAAAGHPTARQEVRRLVGGRG